MNVPSSSGDSQWRTMGLLGLGTGAGVVVTILIWYVTFGQGLAERVKQNEFVNAVQEKAISKMENRLDLMLSKQIEILTELKTVSKIVDNVAVDMNAMDNRLRSYWQTFTRVMGTKPVPESSKN